MKATSEYIQALEKEVLNLSKLLKDEMKSKAFFRQLCIDNNLVSQNKTNKK